MHGEGSVHGEGCVCVAKGGMWKRGAYMAKGGGIHGKEACVAGGNAWQEEGMCGKGCVHSRGHMHGKGGMRAGRPLKRAIRILECILV